MTADLTVVVVDDHTIFRQALVELLDGAPGIQVVGSAGTVEEALQVLGETQPAVVVIDIELAGERGTVLVRRLEEVAPSTRSLVLSAHSSSQDLRAALEAGAAGYLLKGVTIGQLVDGVRRAAAGEMVLDPELVTTLVDGISGTGEGSIASLSVREHEVVRLVAEGKTNDAIARDLTISPRTIQKHVENIFRKMNVNSRAELVQKAFRSGMIR